MSKRTLDAHGSPNTMYTYDAKLPTASCPTWENVDPPPVVPINVEQAAQFIGTETEQQIVDTLYDRSHVLRTSREIHERVFSESQQSPSRNPRSDGPDVV